MKAIIYFLGCVCGLLDRTTSHHSMRPIKCTKLRSLPVINASPATAKSQQHADVNNNEGVGIWWCAHLFLRKLRLHSWVFSFRTSTCTAHSHMVCKSASWKFNLDECLLGKVISYSRRLGTWRSARHSTILSPRLSIRSVQLIATGCTGLSVSWI